MEVQINLWAVVLATVSSMVVGSIWYAQAVFGKRWAQLANIDLAKDRNNADMYRPLVITLVVSFITAYVLAHLSYLANQFFWQQLFARFAHDRFLGVAWFYGGTVYHARRV